MKIETSPVLVLDSFTALRWKSYTFSQSNSNPNGIPYGITQKAKRKRVQKAPKCEVFKNSFMSETTKVTKYSICSILHQ